MRVLMSEAGVHLKVNIGCGNRYLQGWDNLDFRPVEPQVQRWDLRKLLPYADGVVDLVYSSHLLEHLSPEQAEALLKDSLRVLKPGGIVRVVVPDLEALARRYLEAVEDVRGEGGRRESRKQKAESRKLRVESREQGAESREQGVESRELKAESRNKERGDKNEERRTAAEERHDWAVIFLVDQLCRTQSGGRMLAKLAEYKGALPDFLRERFPDEWLEGVLGKAESRKRKAETGEVEGENHREGAKGAKGRTGGGRRVENGRQPDSSGLQSAVFCLQSVIRRISLGLRWRWRVLGQKVDTWQRRHAPGIWDWRERRRVARYLAQGERHQWMYDEVSLGQLLADCGFVDVQRMTAGSTLSPFGDELRRLDMTEVGGAYQPFSLYMEGARRKRKAES
jgi:predicted SAM-dependent methyltransferase